MYGTMGVHVVGRTVDWVRDFYRSRCRSKGCIFSKIRTSRDWLIDIQRCVVCKSILHSPSYTTCLCSWCSYTNQSGLFPHIFLVLVLVLKDLANFWSSERSISISRMSIATVSDLSWTSSAWLASASSLVWMAKENSLLLLSAFEVYWFLIDRPRRILAWRFNQCSDNVIVHRYLPRASVVLLFVMMRGIWVCSCASVSLWQDRFLQPALSKACCHLCPLTLRYSLTDQLVSVLFEESSSNFRQNLA